MGVTMIDYDIEEKFPLGTRVILNALGRKNISKTYHGLEGEIVAHELTAFYVRFKYGPSIVCFQDEVEIINNSKKAPTIEWV